MLRSRQLGCRTLLIIISARLAAAENLNEIGASQLRLQTAQRSAFGTNLDPEMNGETWRWRRSPTDRRADASPTIRPTATPRRAVEWPGLKGWQQLGHYINQLLIRLIRRLQFLTWRPSFFGYFSISFNDSYITCCISPTYNTRSTLQNNYLRTFLLFK
jgi:hypothetical protein